MNETHETHESHQLEHIPVVKRWYRHQMLLFISGSIFISLLLVLASLALYNSSGAAQLDLSRPGYKSVQSEVDQSNSFVGYSSDGPVDANSLKQFLQLYQNQVKTVSGTDVYNIDPLGDQALGIDDPDATATPAQ